MVIIILLFIYYLFLLKLFLLSFNFFLFSCRSSDGQILIVSSSDGYCSIIHFEEGELGKIYKVKNSVDTVLTEVRKSSDKKSKNIINKDNAIKSNISTFDVDDCAMDIDLVKCDTTDTIVYQPKEVDRQKFNNMDDKSEVSDLQTDKKSGENSEETEDIKLVYEESNSNTSKPKIRNTPSKADVVPIISHKTPRRVKLITLSSPKGLKK